MVTHAQDEAIWKRSKKTSVSGSGGVSPRLRRRDFNFGCVLRHNPRSIPKCAKDPFFVV